MYQLTAFVRFREGADREEARTHWRDVHGPLGKAVPGVARYVQNHIAPLAGDRGARGEPLFFDGYASFWFQDVAAFEAAKGAPQWGTMRDDTEHFLDMSATVVVRIDERVIKDGAHAPFKEIGVVRFKTGIGRQEASDYWTNTHGPLGVDTAPEMLRYTQNHVLGAVDTGGPNTNAPFDGFAEHWFADRESYLRTVNAPGWERARQDGFNVFDMAVLWETPVEEIVIKE